MPAAPRREIDTPAYVLTQDAAGGPVTLTHKSDASTRLIAPALMDELMSDAEFLADRPAHYVRIPADSVLDGGSPPDDWELD